MSGRGTFAVWGIFWAGLTLVGIYTTLWAGEMTFDTQEDWSKWQALVGTVEFTERGEVKPAFIQRNVNACLNAEAFGGGVEAGSNPTQAGNILDGDEDTWWSPRAGDALKDCWIEVDLGRLITATRMVLRFARAQKPFEQFEVYVSAGNEAFFYGSKLKDYKRLFRTTRPNDRYEVEETFTLDSTTRHNPTSPMVRYIYLRLTAPSEGGALAELEVYELGDNIALGTLGRRGSFESLTGIGAVMVDGGYATYWLSVADLYDWTQRGWIWVDLGALFWVDTIRHVWFESFDNPGHVINYKLFVSDGSVKGGGGGGKLGPMKDLAWEEVGSLDRNPPPGAEDFVYVFEEQFPIRPVRYIFFSHRMPDRGLSTGGAEVGISELQVYGEGYMLGAQITSPILDLGGTKSLTAIRWKGDIPSGTRVEVRTRTGESLEEVTHYYSRDGKEITKKKHDTEIKLFGKSGPVVIEQIPDTTWSGWSEIYPYSGSRFLSPSPRRYLLIQVGLPSDDPGGAPSLDRLTLVFTDPLAQALVGEITPGRVPAATPQDFAYFILPRFDVRSKGFDQILIRTPSKPTLKGVELGEQPLEATVVPTSSDTLLVQLPSLVRSPKEVVVRFVCMVFSNGTPFEAFVGNSAQPDAWQRVDAGDATARSRTDKIVVSVPVADKVISEVLVKPQVITPNGDGVNDGVEVGFTVLKMDTPRRIEVGIYSVEGVLVKKIPLGIVGSGRYRVGWDGTDASGGVVAPGLYLLCIQADTDAGSVNVSRTIPVVF